MSLAHYVRVLKHRLTSKLAMAVCFSALLGMTGAAALAGVDDATPQPKRLPIPALKEQGARPFGGTELGDPTAGSIACDHGYVEWEIPVNARRYPMLMVHASSTKTWQTTFDDRDGFIPIFLRRDYAIYWTDLPRTGRAGQGCAQYTYTPVPNNDQSSFNSWRLGLWLPGQAHPTYYPGVQEARDKHTLDEFLRIQYPEFDTPANEQIETDAMRVLMRQIGPSIMFTHSSTGIRGWWAGIKDAADTAAIIAYEPGNCVFPQGEVPPPFPRTDGTKVSAGEVVTKQQFLQLTKFPIQIVWGDNIPDSMNPINVGPRLTLDSRRINRLRADLFAAAINRHGGNATVIKLPEIGIHGNTHFIMLDLNNVQIADLVSKFLKQNHLDSH